MNALDTILGMGYSGYCLIDGIPILMLPSSASESDELLESQASHGTDTQHGSGMLPARDRRRLALSITGHVNRATFPLFSKLSYGPWRDLSAIDTFLPLQIEVYPANKTGYRAEFFAESLSFTVANEQLINFSIEGSSYVWEDADPGAVHERISLVGDPLDEIYHPIPHYQGCVLSDSLDGDATVQDWTLSLKNNWTYDQFCEAYTAPPNPQDIYPGPLDVDLSVTAVASLGYRPRESGQFTFVIGEDPHRLEITAPLMVRKPQRQLRGAGSQDTVSTWEVSYHSLGQNLHDNQ